MPLDALAATQASGAASQYFGSRRKVACAFIAATGALTAAFLTARGASLTSFYAICAVVSLVFVARWVNETKGRTLEDMESAIN